MKWCNLGINFFYLKSVDSELIAKFSPFLGLSRSGNLSKSDNKFVLNHFIYFKLYLSNRGGFIITKTVITQSWQKEGLNFG
jgi:hypothetical protein